MKAKKSGLPFKLLITLLIAILILTLSSCGSEENTPILFPTTEGAGFGIIHPTTDPYSWNTAAALVTTGSLTNISFVDSNPDRITRAAGDFTADGFVADEEVMVVGSQLNEGVYTIDVAAALTLTLAASDSLQNEPADPGYSVIITNSVLVRVNAPDQSQVVFETTVGTWDGGVDMIVTKPVDPATNRAEAYLLSNVAGTANVLVTDFDDPATWDSLTVIFSAPGP